MPKSKRDKKISLTKTSKKGVALKQHIIEDVKNCVETYQSIYVFSVHNMRNELMKGLREEWKPSRFFFGKNKIIARGFGRNVEEEIADDLHKLTECLKGQCGLLFTDQSEDYVKKWFANYSVEDYARSGCTASSSITIPEGPLTQFSHAMEPYLRQLGLPTSLERGVITMLKEYEVCKKGSILTPEQARILKLFEYKQAAFRLVLKGVWKKDGGFEKFDDQDDEDETNNDVMECEDDEENE